MGAFLVWTAVIIFAGLVWQRWIDYHLPRDKKPKAPKVQLTEDHPAWERHRYHRD